MSQPARMSKRNEESGRRRRGSDHMNLRSMLSFRARRRPPSVNAGLLMATFAAGAAAAALFEPRSGARRRSLVVQKAIHARKATTTFGQKAARDLANRSRGLLASARSSVRDGAVPDEVLRERVRSRIGRLTSHPSAIEVVAHAGVVELRGPVLESEADQVLEGARRVRGAHEVMDRLERHRTAANVPGLQGGAGRSGPVPELMQQNWAPGTRLLMVALGVGLAAVGARSRRQSAFSTTLLGSLLALRGATNLPLKRLVGIGGRRRALDLRLKSLLEHGRAEGGSREDLRH